MNSKESSVKNRKSLGMCENNLYHLPLVKTMLKVRGLNHLSRQFVSNYRKVYKSLFFLRIIKATYKMPEENHCEQVPVNFRKA